MVKRDSANFLSYINQVKNEALLGISSAEGSSALSHLAAGKLLSWWNRQPHKGQNNRKRWRKKDRKRSTSAGSEKELTGTYIIGLSDVYVKLSSGVRDAFY